MELNLVRGLAEAEGVLARHDPLDLTNLPESVLERTRQAFGADVTPEQSVVRMLEDVRREGDAAVRRYANLLDGLDLADFLVPTSPPYRWPKWAPAPAACLSYTQNWRTIATYPRPPGPSFWATSAT